MAGQIKINQVQLGDSATATQNFVLQTNTDGTAKLSRGNVGATTQDIFTIDASGRIAFPNIKYVSAPQTITAGGLLTLPHGLGVAPTLLFGFLTCTTAENGYSIGDKVPSPIHQQSNSSTDSFGAAVVADATNITIRYGNSSPVWNVLNKTTGSGIGATNTNWTFTIEAWAL